MTDTTPLTGEQLADIREGDRRRRTNGHWMSTAEHHVTRLLAEVDQLRARLAAVLDLISADPADDINAPWVPARHIRAATRES